jgi:hypothetical protein
VASQELDDGEAKEIISGCGDLDDVLFVKRFQPSLINNTRVSTAAAQQKRNEMSPCHYECVD